jgi:multiple sugar transport system ATP-binding protein
VGPERQESEPLARATDTDGSGVGRERRVQLSPEPAPVEPPGISFQAVTKVFPDGTVAVRELTLEVGIGELVVLVGPSGCGKTTALRMVAGLEAVTEGTISIGGETINDVDPRDRDVAMVFQNYALYPHMSVSDNMAFGLRMRRLPKAEIRARVTRIAELLDLTDHLERKPAQLSGGQRQRVAMGRAIVRQPQAFLMDEPLSNLDTKLRVQMRAEIAKLQHELRTTTLYVTHDQVEAMTLGDRVAVLRGGVLQQVDTPQALYRSPTNLFVASFIGSPPMNLLQAQLHAQGDSVALRIGDEQLPLPASVLQQAPRLKAYAGRLVGIGIRPEHLTLTRRATGSAFRGPVVLNEELGSDQLVHVGIQAQPVVRDEVLEGTLELDSAEVDEFHSERAGSAPTVVARIDPEVRIDEGATVELGLDSQRLHFFDIHTGEAIAHPISGEALAP